MTTYDAVLSIRLSLEDIEDIVEGLGALQYPWWHEAIRNGSGEWVIVPRNPDNGGEEDPVTVGAGRIAKAVERRIRVYPESMARALYFDEEAGQLRVETANLDADDGDVILQYAVFGSEVYA